MVLANPIDLSILVPRSNRWLLMTARTSSHLPRIKWFLKQVCLKQVFLKQVAAHDNTHKLPFAQNKMVS
jgi:hypothetical protein